MRWGSRVDEINTWWERSPKERYWLDVTNRNDRHMFLATPRGVGKSAGSWTHQLITHVKEGDVVFHYDDGERAIVAWSISHGRVEKMNLSWPPPAEPAGAGLFSRTLPSWAIGLRRPTKLGAPVSLGEIARTQWNLFPSLRALEDEVGDPLYYPFGMGNRDATCLLSGYVFKLPAVFVQGFPELASAAVPVSQPLAVSEAISVPAGSFGASSPSGLVLERSERRARPGLRESFAETDHVLQGSR